MNAEPDKVEPVLQPTKDRYRLLAENISDVIFTLDLNLRYTYCSPSVERLRGYTVEEVMALTPEQMLAPASYEIAKKTVEEGLARERAGVGTSFEPETLELELTRKGGGTVWAEVKVSFLHDASGGLVGILGVSRDITKRKSAEEALRESEEKHRLLFQKATDPVLLLDGDTYVDCNEAALNFIGCSRHQLIGLHPWDVSPERQPDGCMSRQKAREIIETTLKEGVSRFEWLHRTFDGRELWAEVSLTGVPIGGRRVVYAQWRDIEKRKRAEEALIISRLHLSEAMDLAKIVYWELDYATETFLFDGSFYAFYGTTAEHEGGYRMAIGEYDKRFVHPNDRAMVRQSAQNIKRGKNREFLVDLEHRIVRRDNEVRYILARTRGFRDAEGRISRCYGANQDITDRKQAEDAIAAKSHALEEMNTALRVLLNQREDDKRELEQRIRSNVQQLILPYLENLKDGGLTEHQRSTLDVIEMNLKAIASPLLGASRDRAPSLSHREIEIINLIKLGRTSKQIAKQLHLGKATIDFHRDRIRRKLGLVNDKVDLRTHLLSLA